MWNDKRRKEFKEWSCETQASAGNVEKYCYCWDILSNHLCVILCNIPCLNCSDDTSVLL